MITQRGFFVALVALVLATVVFGMALRAAVQITEADRAHRTARTEACRSVEGDALRTLCIAAARP